MIDVRNTAGVVEYASDNMYRIHSMSPKKYGKSTADATVVVLKPCTGHQLWGTLRKVGLQVPGEPRCIERYACFGRASVEHDKKCNGWLDSRLATETKGPNIPKENHVFRVQINVLFFSLACE